MSLTEMADSDLDTLAPLDAPETHGELSSFLTIIINGAYGQHRAEIAQYDRDAFMELREAEHALGSLQFEPHDPDEALPAGAAAHIDTILRIMELSPAVKTAPSVTGRIGGWAKDAMKKVGVL